MSKVTNVWLVRHGQIILPSEKIYVGQTELPLSPVGQRQMLDLRNFFASKSICTVISSSLGRCYESAKLLCPDNIPIILDKNLREINLGTWDGQSIAKIKSTYPAEYAERGANLQSFRPPHGESFNDLAIRVYTALDDYLSQYAGQNIVLVAHAGVNRAIIAKYMNIPLDNLLDISQPYASCTFLQFA